MLKRTSTRAGRKRKALGSLSLVLGSVVAAAWVWSGWNWAAHFKPRHYMVVDAGTVDIAYAARARWLGREYASKSEWPSWPTFTWWGGPAYREIDERGLSLGVAYVAVVAGQEVRVYLVLWPYSFLLAGAGLWLLRSGVRAGRDAAGKCRDCAYDFTGLSGGAKCPECGRSRA